MVHSAIGMAGFVVPGVVVGRCKSETAAIDLARRGARAGPQSAPTRATCQDARRRRDHRPDGIVRRALERTVLALAHPRASFRRRLACSERGRWRANASTVVRWPRTRHLHAALPAWPIAQGSAGRRVASAAGFERLRVHGPR